MLNKIAFVSTNKSSWGGSEYLWYLTALRLKDSGKKIIASVPRWKDIPDSINKLRSKKIPVTYNTDYPKYKKLINRLVPKSLQLGHEEDGYKFLLDFKPEIVVISQGGNTGGIDLMEYCIKHDLKFITISNGITRSRRKSFLNLFFSSG